MNSCGAWEPLQVEDGPLIRTGRVARDGGPPTYAVDAESCVRVDRRVGLTRAVSIILARHKLVISASDALSASYVPESRGVRTHRYVV